MKTYRRRIATLLLACSLATACVTSGPTGKVSEPDMDEAARLNLDLGITYLQQGKLEDSLEKRRASVRFEPTAVDTSAADEVDLDNVSASSAKTKPAAEAPKAEPEGPSYTERLLEAKRKAKKK